MHYLVEFVPPVGRSFTIKDAPGGDESVDSDANPNSYSDIVLVLPGQNSEVGAGLLPVPTATPTELPIPTATPTEVEAPANFDLALHKTLANGQTSLVQVGDNVRFTLEVVNLGNVPAANIELVDQLPTRLVLNDSNWDALSSTKADYVIPGPLAPGQAVSVDIVVAAGYVVTTRCSCVSVELVNTAMIVSAEDVLGNFLEDSDPSNDEAEAAMQVGFPTMTIKLSTPSINVLAGEQIVYSMIYTNTSELAARNVVVKEVVPLNTTFVTATSSPGWVCTQITAGSTCTYAAGTLAAQTVASAPLRFVVAVNGTLAPTVVSITNQATVTFNGSIGQLPSLSLVTLPVVRSRAGNALDVLVELKNHVYLPMIQNTSTTP